MSCCTPSATESCGTKKSCCGRKKCLARLGLVLLGIVLGFFIVAARLPETQTTVRSVEIAAPAGKIYPQLANLKNWNNWSPWAKLDPKAKVEFSGPASGKNAVMTWDGNMQVGKGTITIVEATQNERVRYRLDMEKPSKGTMIGEFHLDGVDGGKTRVTWSGGGTGGFWMRVFTLIMNCPGMMDDMFNEGLEKLQAFVAK